MTLQLIREVRDINRFREILSVLFDQGFDFLIEEIRLKHKLPFKKRIQKPQKKYSIEKRLRLTLEKLGPTFIKFGQVLSVRPDLVPKRYIQELEKLQDKVPPMPYSDVEKQIKKELGKSIKSLFKEFEKEPIASASISQVHKATLHDGSVVAVKVQRPTVKTVMETDIEIMYYIAHLLEKHMPVLRKYSPTQIIQEFQDWTKQELNFRHEALNARKFARNFKHDKYIKIPTIYKQLTTKKVLVMEFIDGIELNNTKQLRKKHANIHKLFEKGFSAILQQVFEHGFFHADPHPGNILITKKRQIAFVDFGIVGRFTDELKQKSIDLFYGVIENDAKAVVNTLIEISNSPVRNKEELEDEVSEILDSLQDSDIKSVKVSYVLEEVLDLALHYGLKVPKEFVLFGKTVVTLEGIALEYNPHFHIVESSKPFLKEVMMQRYNPLKAAKETVTSILSTKKYLEKIPEQTSRALAKIESGSIHVDIEDTDIKQLSMEIDRSSNRVAYAMLIAALLIVGALTINFGSPIAFAMPLIPFLSFTAALVLSCILVISIVREKHIIKLR